MQFCAQADPKGSKRLWSEPLQAKLQQQAAPDAAVRLLNVAATAPHPDNYLPPQAVVLAQTSLPSPETDDGEVHTKPTVRESRLQRLQAHCRLCLSALSTTCIAGMQTEPAWFSQASHCWAAKHNTGWLQGIRGPAHAPSEPWGGEAASVPPLA